MRVVQSLTVGNIGLGCLIVLVLIMTGCAQPVQQQRDDPLIGRIVDGYSQEVVTFEQLIARAASSDVVYLAERHDNAEHHQNQLTILNSLIEQGRKPMVGFEFFDIGQTGYLMQYVDAKPSSISLGKSGKKNLSAEARLRQQLGWGQRLDRDWNYYFQLIELARVNQLVVFGSDLPASIRLRLSRNGPQQLTAVERQQLSLKPLAEGSYKRFMVERFTDAHCGWSSEPLMEKLYRTWYERNYRMATSVVVMATTAPAGEVEVMATGRQTAGPVVMILGAGHSEYNQAVVAQVADMAPHLKQLNIGLQEIAVEARPLAEYIEGDSTVERGFAPRHDLFWFSQRQDYRDHCAELMSAH